MLEKLIFLDTASRAETSVDVIFFDTASKAEISVDALFFDTARGRRLYRLKCSWCSGSCRKARRSTQAYAAARPGHGLASPPHFSCMQLRGLMRLLLDAASCSDASSLVCSFAVCIVISACETWSRLPYLRGISRVMLRCSSCASFVCDATTFLTCVVRV